MAETCAWNVLPSTRVGALDVNAGARRAVLGPQVRPRTGMNLAPVFGYDAQTPTAHSASAPSPRRPVEIALTWDSFAPPFKST